MDRLFKREVETGCEYTLPDYMGDIKRILFSCADAVPSGKFVSDGSIMLSGLVNFKVLYSDSEGKLTSFTQSAELDIKENADISGDVDVGMVIRPESVSGRVVGPRKVALRSLVSVSVTVSGENDVQIHGDVFGDPTRDDIETMSVEISALTSRFHTSGEREYAEEATRLVGVTSDDVEIISTSGRVTVFESVAEDSGVRVKGEMIITSIVRTTDQPPFAITKTIPFDEHISIEGVREGEFVSANAYLTSETMGVAEDGDATVLTANVICEFALAVSENKSIEVIKDAYLVGKGSSCEYNELGYLERIADLRSTDEITHTILRDELGLGGVRDILMADASFKPCEIKNLGGSVEISGNVVFSGVACEVSGGEQLVYLPFKTEAPFCVRVNSSSQISEDSTVDAVITGGEIRCSLDSERLSLLVDVNSELHIRREHSEKRLYSFTECSDGEVEACLSEIVVYYPDVNETLYDVAKLHHVRTSELAFCNGIAVDASTSVTGETLHSLGVKKVLLP